MSIGGYFSLQIDWFQPCYNSFSTEVEKGDIVQSRACSPGVLWDASTRTQRDHPEGGSVAGSWCVQHTGQWLHRVGLTRGTGTVPRKGICRTLSIRGAFDPQHTLRRVMLAEGLKHLSPSSGNLPLLVLAGGASKGQRKKMCHRRAFKDLRSPRMSGWLMQLSYPSLLRA